MFLAEYFLPSRVALPFTFFIWATKSPAGERLTYAFTEASCAWDIFDTKTRQKTKDAEVNLNNDDDTLPPKLS